MICQPDCLCRRASCPCQMAPHHGVLPPGRDERITADKLRAAGIIGEPVDAATSTTMTDAEWEARRGK